ncbi:MAG: SBBP repeat-containing protein [Nitrospiraceae bacterium]|nr:SBBP repeat-containing protein [Nitrospiraceae bacterium]
MSILSSFFPRRPFLPAALVALVLITACSPAQRRIEPANLYWPLPPDPPRIHYVQSIYSEDDIGREYSLKERLFGKEYLDVMARPYGVTTRQGKIFVSDVLLKRVVVFDQVAKRMSMIGEEGAVLLPAAVAVDEKGTIYVADAGGGKIAVYDVHGEYLTAFPLKGGKPVGIALNRKLGRLYVVDRNEHRVVVLGIDGKELLQFGSRGANDGQFNLPLDIAIDERDGTVGVVDAGNFRVELFTADGVFLSKFGEVGDRPGTFANPKGIAFDSDGNIYVTDAAFCNFQIFNRQGATLLFVGQLGPQPGYFHLPAGISVDEQDRIYVADQLNARIEVFQYLKAKEEGTAH